MLHNHMNAAVVKTLPESKRTVLTGDAAERAASEAGSGIELGPLNRHVGYALRRAQLAVFNDFIATLEQVNLRPGQFSVLTLIGENPGIVQRRVCETLAIKSANFVPLYAELERRQLTKRVAIDRRSNGLYLTAKGRALVARAQLLCDRHESRITATIGEPESRQLIDLLVRIAGLGSA
jgi:DNA-binding MarR family transcriptional regulator